MMTHYCSHMDGNKACVSLVPIFNHLEASQLQEIMGTVRSVSFKKGEFIFHAGDASNSLYIVHKGRVKISRLAESGREKLVRILNPGEFTGELAVFQEAVHESYAEALTDTAICMIKQEDLQELLLKYPSISLKILNVFSHRLEDSERQSTSFATEKVEMRIAHFLIECLEENDEGKQEIELPMSKKDLASYLGTTPETLSRRLTDFEEAGNIHQKGHRKIEILDADGLLLM